jgi:hypothetical protein
MNCEFLAWLSHKPTLSIILNGAEGLPTGGLELQREKVLLKLFVRHLCKTVH